MTTTMTHYTTQDLASPYADLERLPRLTAEEEARLLYNLRLAPHAHSAKQRLIEGYLPRVLTLAKQYDRQYRVITFDDLVQEGSLALMGAIDKCASMPITTSLSAYVGTVVRSAFARAIATDAPIHMPNSTWHYIHNTGRTQEFAWMQTMRLDVARNAEGETFADTLPAPALVLPAHQPEQEQQRRQLVRLLAVLSERQRQVFTMRYGLDPADARTYSREETARLLGLSRGRSMTPNSAPSPPCGTPTGPNRRWLLPGHPSRQRSAHRQRPHRVPARASPFPPGGDSTTSASTPSNRPSSGQPSTQCRHRACPSPVRR